jgi:SpoVK/Ycf46/Vps4 family AAA+-type ATPase
MSPNALLNQSPLEQQAAWLVLRLALHEPALRFAHKLLDQKGIRSWLLGTEIDAEASDETVASAQEHAAFEDLKHTLDERFLGQPFYPGTVSLVGDRFGLNETERRIVWLSVIQYFSTDFRDAMQQVEQDMFRGLDTAQVVAALIDRPAREIVPAIGAEGRLVEIGLLDPISHHSELDDYLRLSHAVATALREGPETAELLQHFLHTAKPTVLSAVDFTYLREDFEFVAQYLRAALINKTPGVNVLFYGIPGTGKTEFAAVIAAHLGVPLYAVPEEQRMNKMGHGAQTRLSAYRMSQSLLAASPALLLFDDVEDGILDLDESLWSRRSSGKAMLNTLLESNSVPSIWITNVAFQFDAAHLRRFDLSVAFKTLPRAVRASMVNKALHDLPLSPAFKLSLAESRQLIPAHLNKISRVVGHVAQGQSTPVNDAQPGFDALANYVYTGMNKLLFGPATNSNAPHPKTLNFELHWLNVSVPAARIIERFQHSATLTACFHGLPGSGKTAFAEHIAGVLDKPVLIKRGSDLLRPFLGETEMLLRDMFEEAMDDGALLLLDEADSFLTERAQLLHSWEITQVNELLTQIERFRGHFIATTNAFNTLDQASLRRFDVKAQFDTLLPDQRMRMLEALLRTLGLAPEAALSDCWDPVMHALNDMPLLTPGDFAVVARQFNVSSQDLNVFTLLDALREEHHVKKARPRSIGFNS